MTNYNNTDKIIKSKYEADNPVFDMEAMWTELAPQVEKKNRRGWIFWILPGLVVISLLVVGYLMYANENSNENIVQVNSSTEEILLDNEDEKYKNVDHVLVDDEDESVMPYFNEEIDANVSKFDIDEIRISNSIARKVLDKSALNQNDNVVEQLLYATSIMKSSKLVHADISSVELNEVAVKELSKLDKINSIERRLLIYERDRLYLPPSTSLESYSVEPISKNNLRIGVDAGYYVHSRSFESIGDDLSQNFGSRSSEEEAKDGYDLGIRLEYFLTDHLAVIGGVRYSKSYVQRNANYVYTQSITLKDHVVQIINTEEGPIEKVEDVTYDGVFTHIADNYITATRLGLITGLQYRIGADRWITRIDAGIELPVWSSHSGIITHEGKPYNLSDETYEISSTSIQVFGGFGVEYALSPVVALQSTIRGYIPLNNEHVSSYGIEKKSSLMGLSLGVNFRL